MQVVETTKRLMSRPSEKTHLHWQMLILKLELTQWAQKCAG